MGGRSARESIVSLYGGRHPIRILALYGKAVVGGLGGGRTNQRVSFNLAPGTKSLHAIVS